jgi:hypothetical protein
MLRQGSSWLAFGWILLIAAGARGQEPSAKPVRLGLAGIDSPQSLALAERFNTPDETAAALGCRVVVALVVPHRDFTPEQKGMLNQTAIRLQKLGVELVDSMDEINRRSEGVMFESGEFKNRRADVESSLKWRRLVYLDQPAALTTAEMSHVFDVAQQANTACFVASAMRFDGQLDALRDNKQVGPIQSFEVTAQNASEVGKHAVSSLEALQALLGSGADSVSVTQEHGEEQVVAKWQDGRSGVLRFSSKTDGPNTAGVVGASGQSHTEGLDGFAPLTEQIARFFHTRKSPITPEETLEVFALHEGVEESRQHLGGPIRLESILSRAKIEASLWR